MLQVKKYRQKACMTQEQLAFKVDVTKEYISYIENGHKEPSLSTLRKIAKALNVEVSQLLEQQSA